MSAMDWREENQRGLVADLARLRGLLERHAASPEDSEALQEVPATPGSPMLAEIGSLFGLSPFARYLLLLCAGVELDSGIAPLCGMAQGDPQRSYPTFSLALAVLPGAGWHDLSPAAPLRRWRLIEVSAGPTLATSPLRIDERVLCFLLGIDSRDERLAGLLTPIPAPEGLVPSHRAAAERLAMAWGRSGTLSEGDPPVIQLCGSDVASRRAVAAAACELLGMDLYAVAVESLPTVPRELDGLLRLLERETVLTAGALLLELDEIDDPLKEGALARAVEGFGGPVILAGRQRLHPRQRSMVTFEVGKPLLAEQRALWRGVLGGGAARLGGAVESLVWQFDLPEPALRAAFASALGTLGPDEDLASAPGFDATLWDACRDQARPRLDDLAQRIPPAASWEDLVLPERERQTLWEIALHARHRSTVHEAWGFAEKGQRGLGLGALFWGASGTGKTLAAEVLARELRLDLYRIDLALVVSKYIGETEKNLRHIFDAAEEGGAILRFDEADALFGRRSEVKDSHDRHANIEVSYLLQRMEAYRGLAILTTNLKESLDAAFLRRLRFAVQFPFPGMAERAELWRRAFPASTPTLGLDAEKLARLNLAGGNIRNIALTAAFPAAGEGTPVQMRHLLQAARSETSKLGRALTEPEIRGWV